MSSNTIQGDDSRHGHFSPSPDSNGDGPRHTSGSKSDKGLIPVFTEEERERYGEPYMVNEDREFCKLFFGKDAQGGRANYNEAVAGEEYPKKDGKEEPEEDISKRELREKSERAREQFFHALSYHARNTMIPFS